MSNATNNLNSVNWVTGMLLGPEQFRRQDAFVEASFGWIVRNCLSASGLLGGGLRTPLSERGLAKHDPRVDVNDEGTTLSVSVVQACGLSPAGLPIEVGPDQPVRGTFAKSELGERDEALIYLVHSGEREADADSVGADPANPLHPALLRTRYVVQLGLPADAVSRALVVGRIRRASESLAFELDPSFVPLCATVSSHSTLYRGWSELRQGVVQLSGRFTELHRTVARYVEQVRGRGIDVSADLDILGFVERVVLGLDGCAYEILDPSGTPHHVFQQVDRAGRRAALALDLSPATQLFFRTLTGVDAGYESLLEEELKSLAANREMRVQDDLGIALERAHHTLLRLQRLGQALEGKYVDYRMNRSIGSLRFLLDRGGDHFYTAVSTPARAQREGDLTTFVFSDLNLAGQSEYRIVLLGDTEAPTGWQVGDSLTSTLRINSASGKGRPQTQQINCDLAGQRNFAVNFTTPADVSTIQGLHLTIEPGQHTRGAVLYQRRLGLPQASPTPATARPAPAATTGPASKANPSASSAKRPKITIKRKS